MKREVVRENGSTFVRVFGDIIYSLDTLKEPAFDGLLRGRIKKARSYLDALEDALNREVEMSYRTPRETSVVVDIVCAKHVEIDCESEVAKGDVNDGTKESDVFEIEEIRGIKFTENGEDTYLIKWKGFSQSTWEPRSTIDEGEAEDLVIKYKKNWNLKHPEDPWTDV